MTLPTLPQVLTLAGPVRNPFATIEAKHGPAARLLAIAYVTAHTDSGVRAALRAFEREHGLAGGKLTAWCSGCYLTDPHGDELPRGLLAAYGRAHLAEPVEAADVDYVRDRFAAHLAAQPAEPVHGDPCGSFTGDCEG